MAGRVQDRVALVTGAARGIGEGIAQRLAEEGARLVIFDLELGAVDEAARRLEAAGVEAVGVAGDASSTADAERAVQAALERFGRLDILVNNAGINRDAQLMRMTDEQWDAVLDVDLKGPFLFARAAAAPMRAQQYGRIVNMSSSSTLGNFGQANYSAAKGGLIALTRTLAVELARYQVTANAICPGWIDTPMTRQVPNEIADRVLSKIRLGRAGTPRDVANLVLFLASDEASYITGQTIMVCGGMTVGLQI